MICIYFVLIWTLSLCNLCNIGLENKVRTTNSANAKFIVVDLTPNDTNTNRGVIDFFQGELIFLFIISISLHNLRTVSGFFLLNNDDSFNVFGM
jgi:hypothetical protein